MLSIMDIFKHLPAAKKLPDANCKKCGLHTCMMFAVKLSKNELKPGLCPYMPDELIKILEHANKIQQEEIVLSNGIKTLKIGGEKVLYRHEKTFINPPPLLVELDDDNPDFLDKLNKISRFKIELLGNTYTVDGIYIEIPKEKTKEIVKEKGLLLVDSSVLSQMILIEDKNYTETLNRLSLIRNKAIINRDENYTKPVCVKIFDNDASVVCAKASSYICKYASCIIFENFREAVFSSLIMLRQNIFTDPQMPLQVDSKVYEFNNPDENAYVFLTTNFALSYFAVANELMSLNRGSYLVITPSEGMSVLTAWSAQKITADIASQIVSADDTLSKVKNKKLIIPGLLADLKDELQQLLPEWEIITGTIEACKIPEFVKKLGY